MTAFFMLRGGESIAMSVKGASDPAEHMEEVKSDFIDLMEETDFVTPTDEEIERYRSEFTSLDEATQTELAKNSALLSLGSISLVLNYLALMVHGRTMCQLVADAMGGDDDAYTRCAWFESVVWMKARLISTCNENCFMTRRMRRSPTDLPRRRR